MIASNKLKFSELIEPKISVELKKGCEYSFIPMENVEPGKRNPRRIELKVFNGGGSRFADDDILFARITPCLQNKKIAKVKNLKGGIGFGSTEFFIFRAKKGFANPDFLYYTVKLDDLINTAILSMVGASGRQRADIKSVYNYKVYAPDLQTQSHIASVLSTYDDLIEINEKRIKLLEEMTKHLYTEWFVKFKFPGYKKVKLVESKTEYGKIPEGWEVKRLRDVVVPQYGYTASAELNDSFPKYLRGTDINKNSFIDWMQVPNCKIDSEDFEKYKVRKGDVFIIRMADPGKIGICEREVEAVFASYLMRLNIKDSLSPYYLYYFLTSDRYQGFVLGASSGTTRKSVNSQQVGLIDVLIPKKEILKTFEIKACILREHLTKLIEQNNSLTKVRDFLIPQLVMGRRELK